jgi:RsmE family RNA methyltransferase
LQDALQHIEGSTQEKQGRYVCSLRPGAKPLREYPRPKASIQLLVGPEGDFTEKEHALAQEFSFLPLRLTSSILRSETAALVAIAQAEALWGQK